MHEPFEPGGTGHRFLTILATVGVAASLTAVVLRHYPAAWIAALALYGGFEVALGVSQWSEGRSSDEDMLVLTLMLPDDRGSDS